MKCLKLSVLILEDAPADAELIADALRGAGIDFTVVQVGRGQDFHRLLQEVTPDLIFADHSLVTTREPSVRPATRHWHPAAPFIFISDVPREEITLELVRRGTADCALKQRLAQVQQALREKFQLWSMKPIITAAGYTFPGVIYRNPGEHRIRQLSRLRSAVREIKKLIVRERDPERMLAEACNILIRTRGYLHAGIGLVESRARKAPPITRSARNGAGYLDGFSIAWSGHADEAVPAQAAIHSGQSWVCQDTAADPRFALWKEPALACGCASLAAIPMIHWGQVTGVMTVCSDRVATYHHEEVRLLEEAAGNLAFALDGLRRAEACRSAGVHLRLLESALKSAANAIVITDRGGCVLWTNPAFTRLTGYPPEEVRGKTTNLLKSGVHDQAFYRQLWETVLAGQVWHSEMVNRRKDGSLFTEDCTITPVYGEGGEIEHFIAVKQDITERKRAEEAMRANLDRLSRQEAALIALTKSDPLPGGGQIASLHRLTEASARALGVARVSLWRFQPGGQAIRCVDLFELPANRHSDGLELIATEYPAYFKALAECDVIAADDAHTEPSTAAFLAGYLAPLGITSLLDVPIRLKGKLEGVLCHEHIGPQRQWTPEERTFAIAIANLVVLAVEEWERTQAQKKLRKSRQAYASLVNTVDGIVWEVDVATFRFTFVSQQAERLLGYPVEEWLRDPDFWRNHLHPDDRESAAGFRVRTIKEMRNHYCYRMIAADGRVVWLRDAVAVVMEDGFPARLRGIMVDITQSRMAEEALHRRKEEFRALVENSPDPVVRYDRSGRRIYVNPAFEKLAGRPAAMLLGRTTAEAFIGDVEVGSQTQQAIESVLDQGMRKEIEVSWRPAAGPSKHYQISFVPELDVKGQVTSVLSVARDISTLKNAEESLRWRTAFFEAQIDSDIDGILVVDGQGRKIFQNRRMVDLWKIPPQVVQDPDDAKQVQYVTSRVKNPQQFAGKIAYLYAHTNEVSRDEIELDDGMVLDRYSSPVRDRDGTYYGRIWTFRDITERRQLEAQFRQAQKMEAVGRLAGGVAHDFNNILTAVMMHLGILRETLTEPGAEEALKELESQTQRAADLTRQLLMFSRKSAIEVKPTNLNHVVEEMLKMLRRLLGEHVSMEFQGSAKLRLVDADRGMMQQVIMNLAVNGRDAMPEGGRLTISTAVVEFKEPSSGAHPERRPGHFARLSVADTGCGMEETTIKRIFEPFFTTKELGKGTGLGLATVYGIIQQHHGWVEVTSEPGKGSTFDVFLPATDKTEASLAAEPPPTLRGRAETILLVEDESMVRLVTARGLQMLGYRVLEAADGKMAMELWNQHADTIQLLFTDMIMPQGISGLDLAERFQKEKPALKVIIASGYSAEISAEGIPSRPGILYLPKPFKTINLATAVRTCLDQK